MPENRSKCTWVYLLNDFDEKKYGCYECRSMTIKRRIVCWFVESPKEGWIGVQCDSGIMILNWLVNTHAIVRGNQCPDDEINDEPKSQ